MVEREGSPIYMRSTHLKLWLLSIALFLGFFSVGFFFSTVNAETDLPGNYGLLRSVKDCVVKIETDFEGKSGVGTGTLVSADGYILTARHILENEYGTVAKKVAVHTPDGETYTGYGVASDKERDLGVIKVEGSDLPHCSLGNSEQLRILDYVLVVGYPYGTFSATEGRVSGILPEGQLPRLQFTAPIASGNSGGPIFNSEGEVVGVVAGMIAKAPGFNYGRPLSFARPLLPPYPESISIEAEAMDFRLDGTLYYISKDGGLWSWKPGDEQRQLHSEVENAVDIAVDRRYIYFLTEGDGPGTLKMYSTFDQKIQVVVDEIEKPGQIAVSSERDLYYTQSKAEDEGRVMVWRYETGNVEEVFATQNQVEALAVEEEETILIASHSASEKGKSVLTSYQASTSKKEGFVIDLAPILDLGINKRGDFYLLAGGEQSGVFEFQLSEPFRQRLVRGGNYSNLAFDNLDNLYLFTGQKVVVLRDIS